ncbi:MAG: ADP-ribosylglycohydrolase family protein [Lachnospiraceae bacterium]|nr:ADP-ribosylglycohydrolase family protein [Lachnospiraceae bacterium]
MTENEMTLSAKKADRKAVRDKILACLYGGALGDALGYVIEFDSWDRIRRMYGENGIQELVITGEKAIISDDTQMTLFTAEGLGYGFFRANERGTGAAAEYYIHQAYLCWLKTQGCEAKSLWEPVSELLVRPEMNHRRAPGNTCLSALMSGEMGTPEQPINNSKGCGGVMRTAPCGFMRTRFSGRPAFGRSAMEIGARAAAITHGHSMGWIPAGMLSDIVDRCLYGNYTSLQEIIEDSLGAAEALYGRFQSFAPFKDMILRAMNLAADNKAKGLDDAAADEAAIYSLGEGWVGDEALAIAVYAVLRWDSDMKKCLRAAVNHRGDSDSTGAVAGNILGAFLGLEAIPKDWLAKLELTDAMEELADMMKRAIELY